VLRVPALRFAPPRLDHLPHDRAAFLGSGAGPARGLRLSSSRLASAPAERDSSRILPFRHARDSSIGARSYGPVDLRSPLHILSGSIVVHTTSQGGATWTALRTWRQSSVSTTSFAALPLVAAGAGDEPLRPYRARQRIMGFRCYNVPPGGTRGPARRPSRSPSPPMPCGSPPAGLVISSNHGGFQPRAARPGSPEDPHSLLDHLIRPLQERRRDRQAEGLGGLEVDD